jgi:hypothetical protein
MCLWCLSRYQSVGTGGDGTEPAKLLQVFVLLLLLLVVNLRGTLLLAILVAVEQVALLLLLSHGRLTADYGLLLPWDRASYMAVVVDIDYS